MKKYIIPQIDFEVISSKDAITVSGGGQGQVQGVDLLDEALWL